MGSKMKFGRELLVDNRKSELNYRLATEGVQVSRKVAGAEVDRIETTIPEIQNGFSIKWEEAFGVSVGFTSGSLEGVKENPKLREFVNDLAPEAISMMMTAYGKEWWKGVEYNDMIMLQYSAEENYLRDELAEQIMDQLIWDGEGMPSLKPGHEARLQLLHTVLAYTDARSDNLTSLRYMADRLKEKNGESNPHSVLDKMGVANERVSELFGWEHAGHTDEAVNTEVGRIFPSILDNANMLSDEGRQKLAKRLGVNRSEEGVWVLDDQDKKTEGKRALYMVAHERLRNKNIARNNDKLKEVLKKDGPDKREMVKYGMDKLVLDLFAHETALDCGRVFQERLRREVINERIKEIRSLEEQRSTQTMLRERVFQVITRAGVEIAYFAQDISNLMGKMTNSLLERVKPGSFLAKVLGGVAEGWRATEEIAQDVTNDIPSDFPDITRRNQRRGALRMPDLFAEFEDT